MLLQIQLQRGCGRFLSAGVAAAVGKAQTIRSAAGTQPVSCVWSKWVPAQPSIVVLPWYIPTLAWQWLGDASPASLLCIVAQIVQEQQSSHHGMLSKESKPGVLQINIFSLPCSAKAGLSQEGCMKCTCHSCARHQQLGDIHARSLLTYWMKIGGLRGLIFSILVQVHKKLSGLDLESTLHL